MFSPTADDGPRDDAPESPPLALADLPTDVMEKIVSYLVQSDGRVRPSSAISLWHAVDKFRPSVARIAFSTLAWEIESLDAFKVWLGMANGELRHLTISVLPTSIRRSNAIPIISSEDLLDILNSNLTSKVKSLKIVRIGKIDRLGAVTAKTRQLLSSLSSSLETFTIRNVPYEPIFLAMKNLPLPNLHSFFWYPKKHDSDNEESLRLTSRAHTHEIHSYKAFTPVLRAMRLRLDLNWFNGACRVLRDEGILDPFGGLISLSLEGSTRNVIFQPKPVGVLLSNLQKLALHRMVLNEASLNSWTDSCSIEVKLYDCFFVPSVRICTDSLRNCLVSYAGPDDQIIRSADDLPSQRCKNLETLDLVYEFDGEISDIQVLLQNKDITTFGLWSMAKMDPIPALKSVALCHALKSLSLEGFLMSIVQVSFLFELAPRLEEFDTQIESCDSKHIARFLRSRRVLDLPLRKLTLRRWDSDHVELDTMNLTGVLSHESLEHHPDLKLAITLLRQRSPFIDFYYCL